MECGGNMSELEKLKKMAKKLYQKANDFGDLDCGRNLAENIRPGLYTARMEFNKIWKQIMEIDPSAPKNPMV